MERETFCPEDHPIKIDSKCFKKCESREIYF